MLLKIKKKNIEDARVSSLHVSVLRRRNTRYNKNPQLVAQHCFFASFLRCFACFTWRDQLDGQQQKKLFRVEEMRRITSKFVARQVVILMKNEEQTQHLLLKVDPRSTFS